MFRKTFKKRKKRKVLIIGSNPNLPGGISTWTREMISHEDQKYLLFFIDSSFGKKGRPKSKLALFVSSFFRNSKTFLLFLTFLLLRTPQIIHSSTTSSPNALKREVLFSRIASLFKSKYIVHFHCTIDEFLEGRKGEKILTKLVSVADGFFCLNKKSIDSVLRVGSEATILKVFHVPNFIDDDYLLNHKIIKSKVTDVIFVSRIQIKKGWYEYTNLAKQHPNITFNVVGPNLDDLNLNCLPSNVVYHGKKSRDEIFSLLDKSDIFVFLTHYEEGFSMVLLEAMSRGLPTLCSNTESIEEMIESSGGLCCDYSNNDQVNQCFSTLVQNEQLRKSMSIFNVSKVRNFYLKSKVIPTVFKYYSTIDKVD